MTQQDRCSPARASRRSCTRAHARDDRRRTTRRRARRSRAARVGIQFSVAVSPKSRRGGVEGVGLARPRAGPSSVSTGRPSTSPIALRGLLRAAASGWRRSPRCPRRAAARPSPRACSQPRSDRRSPSSGPRPPRAVGDVGHRLAVADEVDVSSLTRARPRRNSSCTRVSPAISGWKEITSMLSWRAATGWPSTSARISTPSPCSAIHGARMNTARTGSPSMPGISRSASNERIWRPNALRRHGVVRAARGARGRA